MEYQEASEEVGFKGTMTLVGCGVVWIVILLLILSRWVPMVGWLIVPLLVVFLGLQLLRYAMPAKKRRLPRRRTTRHGARLQPGGTNHRDTRNTEKIAYRMKNEEQETGNEK